MKIGDVAKFQNGFAFKSKDFKKNGEFPIIKIKELKDGEVKFFSDSACVDVDLDDGYRKYLVQEGDVLFALTGDPVNKPNPLSWVGRVSVYNHKEEALINQRVCKLLPTKNVNPKYIYYFFRDFENFYRLASLATGSASQANISTKTIENVEIDLPPINVQNRVVEYLDAISKKIEINNRINNNLEQQARTIYQNMFENIDSLPAGWHKVPLGEVINISNKSFNPLKEPETLLEHYSIPAYDDAKFPVFELSTEIKSNKFIIDDSCFMISKLNPTTKRVWRPYCLTNNAVCSTEFIVYKAKEESLTDYLYSVINSDSFSEFMCSHVTGSTGSRQRTTPKDTLFFEVLVPTEEELETFKTTVAPMYAQMRNIAIENNKLKETRDALLPRLMSGEIDVSNV